jgi:hypothetical protein
MKDSHVCFENPVTQTNQSSGCPSCRQELAVAQAFKREFFEYDGIDELGLRIAAAVEAKVAHSAQRPPRRGVGWYLVAAALALVSVAAVAATHPILRIPWHSSHLSLPEQAPSAPVIAEHAAEAPVDPPVDPAPAPRPVATHATSGAGGDPVPTARDLFTAANAARHDDNGARASALYRDLQRRYPTSAEAVVSRVSFGRVLLDRLDDPGGALAQFDGYLSQTTHTALAEEALFGRASALSQLGRSDAERETWRTLLARYPSSVYADRARVRMGRIQ